MKRVALVLSALVVLGLGAAVALTDIPSAIYHNTIETTTFEVDGDTLLMDGEINSKTLAQFEEIIAAHPEITTLREGVIQGSWDDDTMIPLAYRVRELGLNTELLAESEIYSGGVDLFLAGVTRRAEVGAIVGVHSWSDGTRTAIDYPRDAPEHEQNRKYIEDMLGDDGFYWFTIEAAPFDGIYVMTAQELETYGVLTEPALLAGSIN